MNTEQAALVYATYEAHGDVIDILGAGPNQGQITYQAQNYVVTNAAQFLNYLKHKGTDENPLKNDVARANRLWNQGGHAALVAAEVALFDGTEDGTLDTPGASHFAAVLLAHLRAAKGNTALNDAADN